MEYLNTFNTQYRAELERLYETNRASAARALTVASTDPAQNANDHFMMSAVRCSIRVSRRAKPVSMSRRRSVTWVRSSA